MRTSYFVIVSRQISHALNVSIFGFSYYFALTCGGGGDTSAGMLPNEEFHKLRLSRTSVVIDSAGYRMEKECRPLHIE